MRFISVVTFSLALIPESFLVGQEFDSQLFARVVAEAPVGWKHCSTAFEDCRCTVSTIRRKNADSSSEVSEAIVDSVLARSEFMIVVLDPVTKAEKYRDVLNPRYFFSVKPGSNSSVWALTESNPHGSERTLENVIRTMRAEETAMLNTAAIYGMPLTSIFSDATAFRPVTCQQVRREDVGTVVQCTFDCRHVLPHFSDHDLLIELVPERSWTIHRWRKFDRKLQKGNDMSYEYQTAPNGVPCVKRSVLKRGLASTGDSITMEFGTPQKCPRSAQEFYLPFYGIPESSIAPPKPPRDWPRFLLIAGGVICLCIGGYLYKKRGAAS